MLYFIALIYLENQVMKKNKVLVIFSSGNIGGTERSLSRMAMFDNSRIEFQLSSFGIIGPQVGYQKKHNPILFI